MTSFQKIYIKFVIFNKDKKIAENSFLDWFIRNFISKNKTNVKNDTITISNLFLKNEFISKKTKNEISSYLNRSHLIYLKL